jgi:hypothetical protein
LEPSRKILGGSGKFGAVEKDSGPSQKVLDRSRPDFSLQKCPEAPNQLGSGPLLSAGAQKEDERCGGFAVRSPRGEDVHHLGSEISSSRTAAAGSKVDGWARVLTATARSVTRGGRVEDLGPSPTLGRLVAWVVANRPEGERFGPKLVAHEVNRHFPKSLRRLVDPAAASVVLRRMSTGRHIHQVRAGKANLEALYVKGPQPAASKRDDDR